MNFFKVTALSLLFLFSTLAVANDYKNYIGKIVPPYPKSHVEINGYLINDRNSNYAVFMTEKNNLQYFWLNKEVARKNNNENPIWKTLDILVITKLQKSYFYALGSCQLNQKLNDKIIALVKYEESKQWLNQVKKAWLVNIKQEKIEIITPEGISCANESWGE